MKHSILTLYTTLIVSILSLTTLASSAFAAEPLYEAEIYEFAPYFGEPHQALKITEKDSVATRFKTSEPFLSVLVSCPSYSNNVGNLRLSLFRWTETL